MAKDMTTGKPMKLIFYFFIPLLFGNLFQQLYSMVDSVIVGKFVGVNALAGVGATGSLNFLILGFATGVCSGFGIMVGQSFGAKDYKAMRNYIANTFYLVVVTAMILTPITMILCHRILIWMDTPEEIFADAYSYFIVILAGILLTMIYNTAAAILRAIGDSRTPLFALIGASVINIILDFLLVVGFHMGTIGAGIATVISQGISGIVCLIYMFKRYEVLRFQKGELHRDFKKMSKLLMVGLPMALQFSITAIGSITIQCAVNKLGAAAVASMTTGSKISIMFNSAMDVIGVAMATYCSQNMGAREYGRIKKGIGAGIFLAMVFCVFSISVVRLFGREMALLFIDETEVEIMDNIIYFLNVNTVFFPLLGILLILRNSLQGMGYSFIAMFAGVSELIGRCAVAFGLAGMMGFAGVCLANPLAWLLADVILVISYMYVNRRIKRTSDFFVNRH